MKKANVFTVVIITALLGWGLDSGTLKTWDSKFLLIELSSDSSENWNTAINMCNGPAQNYVASSDYSCGSTK